MQAGNVCRLPAAASADAGALSSAGGGLSQCQRALTAAPAEALGYDSALRVRCRRRPHRLPAIGAFPPVPHAV